MIGKPRTTQQNKDPTQDSHTQRESFQDYSWNQDFEADFP